MPNRNIFNFKTDISKIKIPAALNNPFLPVVPDIAVVAAQEFQEFIAAECVNWDYDFMVRNGKMFGILVVQKQNNDYAYLGAVSGKLPGESGRLIPSVFDDATDDYFFTKGMTALTEIGTKIKQANDQSEVIALTEQRRLKSISIQQKLFENYLFSDGAGNDKNILEIFEASSHGNPPSAAGECAAPKLLQYARTHLLRPIAIAEFWWGNPLKGKERGHKLFYPACRDKCRPILEYMLDDQELYNKANNDKF